MGATQSGRQRATGSGFEDKIDHSLVGPERLFLLRLRRLVWLRRGAAHQVDELVLRALDKAIYSTYCDCLELQVGEKARELLAKAA